MPKKKIQLEDLAKMVKIGLNYKFMFKKLKPTLVSLIGLLVFMGLTSLALAQWKEPEAPPPGGQVPAPINVGDAIQYKTGKLKVGAGLDVAQTISGGLSYKDPTPIDVTAPQSPKCYCDITTSKKECPDSFPASIDDSTYCYDQYAPEIVTPGHYYYYKYTKKGTPTAYGLFGQGSTAGVYGISGNANAWGMLGVQDSAAGFIGSGFYGAYGIGTGAGIYGRASDQSHIWPSGGPWAGWLQGNVNIQNGKLCFGGTDCHDWSTSQYWTQIGSSLYPKDTGWNVGIGTTSPNYRLGIVSPGYDEKGVVVIKAPRTYFTIPYNFTTAGVEYPRSLGLGILSGYNYTADIPVKQADWYGGYGGYLGLWADVNSGTEFQTNLVGFISVLRGTGSGKAFGYYANLDSVGTGYTKYGFYTKGENLNYFSGNVGIGTATPGSKLDVRGDIRGADGNFELVNYVKTDAWNFASKPAGWYRIATSENNGGRNSATFELREYADHSNLEFRVGASFNSLNGVSVTVLSHNTYGAATFQKIRLLTKTTYDPMYLEVYVNPHNNYNQPFWVFIKDNLKTGWTLNNFEPGSIPPGYTSTEYDVDEVFVVAQNGDTESLRVDRAGNVGIGTAAPVSKLTLFESTFDGGTRYYGPRLVLSRYWSSDTNMRASSIFHYRGDTTDVLAFGVAGDYPGGVNYNDPRLIANAKMVLTAGGNVGIGTTEPGKAKLAVGGAADDSSGIFSLAPQAYWGDWGKVGIRAKVDGDSNIGLGVMGSAYDSVANTGSGKKAGVMGEWWSQTESATGFLGLRDSNENLAGVHGVVPDANGYLGFRPKVCTGNAKPCELRTSRLECVQGYGCSWSDVLVCTGDRKTQQVPCNPCYVPPSICGSNQCQSCFVKDTKIATKEGQKFIQEIKKGDIVKSFDFGKNKIAYSRVVDTHLRDTDSYFIINGKIRVTGEHPFYTKLGWKKVKELRIGDQLYSEKGWIKIENIKEVKEKVKVYNLTVDNFHNYFAQEILVHNKTPTCTCVGTDGNMHDCELNTNIPCQAGQPVGNNCNETCCETQTEGCIGTATPCSELSLDTCTNQPGCSIGKKSYGAYARNSGAIGQLGSYQEGPRITYAGVYGTVVTDEAATAAVYGYNPLPGSDDYGVYGLAKAGAGVFGQGSPGLFGQGSPGVYGQGNHGVIGFTTSSGWGEAVVGVAHNTTTFPSNWWSDANAWGALGRRATSGDLYGRTYAGVFGQAKDSSSWAGVFEGDVKVTGKIYGAPEIDETNVPTYDSMDEVCECSGTDTPKCGAWIINQCKNVKHFDAGFMVHCDAGSGIDRIWYACYKFKR